MASSNIDKNTEVKQFLTQEEEKMLFKTFSNKREFLNKIKENIKFVYFFVQLSSEKISLTIRNCETIKAIKESIQTKFNIPIKSQKLFLNDVELNDATNLFDTNIKNNSLVTLLADQKGTFGSFFEIEIKMKTEKFMLWVESFDTIEAIKMKILALESFHPQSQILIFNGMQLENYVTLAEYEIQPKSTIIMERRFTGGGYSYPTCLKTLSEEDMNMIENLYGHKEEYNVIPDVDKSLFEFYPKLKKFHFKIDVDNNPKLKKAVYDYTTNDLFFELNLCLNLLNDIPDKDYFQTLMCACLGSYQTDLPDVVFRYCDLNKEELAFYEKNQGKYMHFRSFVSTSRNNKTGFGNTCMVIKLLKGKRNGAIDVEKYSKYSNEKEVLLCAYSRYYIEKVENNAIYLTYLDYYEYDYSI